MRYGELIQSFRDDEIYAVHMVVAHASEHDFFKPTAELNESRLRKRMADVMWELTKNHFVKHGIEPDKQILTDSNQLVPGWYGRRWKQIVPNAL